KINLIFASKIKLNMRKIMFFAVLLFCVGCDNDETENTISTYKNKPKSADLKGFWQLKGIYKPSNDENPNDISLNNGAIAGIGFDEILFLDDNYLRFLNKVNFSDTYSLNAKNRFYWYDENNFIKSLYHQNFPNQQTEIIEEFQFPFRFGETKDTLIVQNRGRIIYLLKTEDVDYEEYSFE